MRRLEPDDPRHGRRYLYVEGCRCELCSKANADHQAGYRARKAGILTADDPRHGKVSSYVNYSCRCEACAVAHAEVMVRQQASRLERGLPDDDPRHGTSAAYQGWSCRCLRCCQAAADRYAAGKVGAR